jgi:hypothetical protein
VTQWSLLDAVDGDALAVDLDHRDPLAVAALELRRAGDVDLVDLELELGRECRELAPRSLAQVAVTGDVERDGDVQG